MPAWIEPLLVLLLLIGSAASFLYILWDQRLSHVLPKVAEVSIVNPTGFFSGVWEVVSQERVVRNRPWVGLFHIPLFYGLIAFLAKSGIHVLRGLGLEVETPAWYDFSLDVVAVVVLGSVVFMGIRRYFVARERLTHMKESAVVLSLIALLMVTQLAERVAAAGTTVGEVNWWAHFLALAVFPPVIAYGKHLHLLIAPVNVVLRHMTELPEDRPVFGADLDMEDEEKLEEEYARLGMPNGVADFTFFSLLDGAACIECGRCNDACPAGPMLKPREHFVMALRDPSDDAEDLAAKVPPEVAATCVQCRACDVVCPTGCRPSRNGLEIRGRLTLEGLYPPRELHDSGTRQVAATGNILGQGPGVRERFVEENDLPIYDPIEHEVLLILGCQGGNDPTVQPYIVATGRLLDAAGILWGVLPEEKCWGEGQLHGGGLMEEWPFWAQERIEYLTDALGGDRSRTILTICPHCRDTIETQYAQHGAEFTDVRLHTPYLLELVREGRLEIEEDPEEAAIHTPCKVVHNAEMDGMWELLERAGMNLHEPDTEGFDTSCCGGGGGGFLWDAPVPVNQKRWEQIRETTGQKKVVTGCPGCHRMLGVAADEDSSISDVSTVLLDRLKKEDAGGSQEED